jgi:hypothetical protein
VLDNLLVQPLLQGLEVLEHGAGVHRSLSSDLFQSVLPGETGAEFEHVLQLLSGLGVLVDAALVQGACVIGCLAEGLVELELQNRRDKVPHIGHIRHYLQSHNNNNNNNK